MFIVHGAWLRKYMRWVLAALLVVLIPGFVVMFTRTGALSNERPLPKIDGKPVDAGQFQQVRSALVASHLISSGERARRSPNFDDQITEQAVLRILLLQQAREFGLRVSPQSLVAYIQRQPVFLDGRGQFDPERYRQFMIRLLHMQVTETDFEEMMRQQLLVQQVQEIVSDGALVTPLEVHQAFVPLFEEVLIEYVRFRAGDQAPPEVGDAEAEAWYKEHAEEYRTSRQVQVRFAQFAIDPAAETISDADLEEYYRRSQDRFTNEFAAVKDEIHHELAEIRARRAAANRATEFTIKLVPDTEDAPRPNFRQLAQEAGAVVGETPLFDPQEGTPELPGTEHDLPAAVAALSEQNPFSDPVTGTNGYYVLEFVSAQPPQIPPFAAVRAKVVVKLDRERAYQAAVTAGQGAAHKVQELVGGGKTFADACAELKLTVLPAGPFSFASDENDDELPAIQMIKETALGLPVGGISPFLRTPDGGLFFRITERRPPGETDFEKNRDRFRRLIAERSREALWDNWLHALWREHQVDLGPIRPPPPPPEEEPPVEEG